MRLRFLSIFNIINFEEKRGEKIEMIIFQKAKFMQKIMI
jgi:hypothetical protein